MTDVTWGSNTDWQNASKSNIAVEDGTFQLASTIPDSAVGKIEDFEDDDISDYEGDTSQFNITQSPSLEGSFSLFGDIGGVGTPAFNDSLIYSKSLTNVPNRGTEFQFTFQFSGGQSLAGVVFGLQDDNENNYYFAGAHNDQENFVYKIKNGSIKKETIVNTASGIYDPSVKYTATIQYRSDGVIQYQDNNSSKSPSITDTEYDEGWFGWVAGESRSGNTGTVLDDATITDTSI